ncbi:MAG TPA: class I SAM-dependent methyltransferase [Gemmataceae bacterium]|nr:class I SAM-dependent methyltransferase [Gemmataceae bacterium]
MENSYSRKLHLWEGWSQAVLRDPSPGSPAGPSDPAEFAQRLYLCESLEPAPPPRTEEGVEPYTLQWFLDIENQRHGGRGRWIPRLLEFAKHSGETLLGLGDGLGTDWLQYARHGAAVIVCSPSAEQLALIRRNFELRGLTGRFLHAGPSALPLESASIDVACVSSLLQGVSDPAAMVEEIYRVLKPGGKVLAVAPARYDVDFWLRLCFPWRRWLPRMRPAVEPRVGYTARGLRRLFTRFIERRVYKRHLRRSEVPHLWRWLPLPFLERLFGHILVLKAFKPLSAAITVRAAA